MKEILAWILLLIVGVALFFGFGKLYNIYDKTINKESVSIQREKFEESKSYIHGMNQDLAKYKREYDLAEESEKPAIANYINTEFANFDTAKITNQDLRFFLESILRGEL